MTKGGCMLRWVNISCHHLMCYLLSNISSSCLTPAQRQQVKGLIYDKANMLYCLPTATSHLSGVHRTVPWLIQFPGVVEVCVVGAHTESWVEWKLSRCHWLVVLSSITNVAYSFLSFSPPGSVQQRVWVCGKDSWAGVQHLCIPPPFHRAAAAVRGWQQQATSQCQAPVVRFH